MSWMRETARAMGEEFRASVRREAVRWAGVAGVAVIAGVTTVAVKQPQLVESLLERFDGDSVWVPEKVRVEPHVIGMDDAVIDLSANAVPILARGSGGVVVSGATVPSTPSISDILTFAATGDSIRWTGSAYSGDGSHDSTQIQIDTAGGNFSAPKYTDTVMAAITVDTVPPVTGSALDSGAVIKVRIRYQNSTGWSAWSDTLQETLVSVWYEFDPDDYASTAAVHNESNITRHQEGAQAYDSLRLVTGVSRPDGGTKALRDTLFAGDNNVGAAAVVGIDITLPDAATDQPTEIWAEVQWRTSSNWNTNQGAPPNDDHKTFLIDDNGSNERWSMKVGVAGTPFLACYNETNGRQDLLGGRDDLTSAIWDGNWHTLRMHYKMASDNATTADGAVECWVDGQLYHQDLTYTSAQTGSRYFNKIDLGRTFNDSIATATNFIWHEYGRIRIYTTNPGW